VPGVVDAADAAPPVDERGEAGGIAAAHVGAEAVEPGAVTILACLALDVLALALALLPAGLAMTNLLARRSRRRSPPSRRSSGRRRR
jgi:hypothetical protein